MEGLPKVQFPGGFFTNAGAPEPKASFSSLDCIWMVANSLNVTPSICMLEDGYLNPAFIPVLFIINTVVIAALVCL